MTASPTNPAAAGHVRPGDRIGKYELLEQVGAGGMSVVWKGRDPLLARSVAVKQLLPASGEREDLRERFQNEARVHQRVGRDHKHLVQVIEFIDDPRGLFIVMEFVDGPTLEQILARQPEPLDERQALGIVGATALALEAIHGQGVIHRDLKPSNLLLPRRGGLKVADFGLAALVAEQDALSLGSVRYMAPELFGEQPVDARADLYSLGMIAYEMLAGRAGFEDAFKLVLRDQRNPALRWVKWHTNPRAKAPPLSQVNPKVSPTLSDLVARLMEKDPAARIGSARELLDAIRRHFTSAGEEPLLAGAGEAGDAAAAGATAPVNPTAPLPKRSRLPLVLAAVLAVLVLACAGIFLYSQHQDRLRAREHRSQGVALFQEARRAYDEGRYDEARAIAQRVTETHGGDPQLGRASLGLAALSRARADLHAGRYTEALTAIDDAEATRAFDDNLNLLQSLRSEARSRAALGQVIADIEGDLEAGDFAKARLRYADARRLRLTPQEAQQLDEVGARIEDQASQAEVARLIARARQMAADPRQRERAIEDLSRAQDKHRSPAIQQLLDQLREQVAYEAAMAEAQAAEAAGNLREAVVALDKVLALRPSPELSERANEYRSQLELEMGHRLLEQGQTAAAAEAFTRSLGYMENADAREQLERIEASAQQSSFVRAGDAAASAGNYEMAIKQYENAQRLGEVAGLEEKITAARVRMLVQRGLRLAEQGRADEARAALQEAQALAPEDEEAADALEEIDRRAGYAEWLARGDALREQSKFGDAKRAYHRAREIMATPQVQERLRDVEYDHLVAQGRSYMAGGDWRAARAVLLSARQIRASDDVRELLEEVAKHLPEEEQ